MLSYALWFYWVAARGYRLRPWSSPLLRWRIETYSGIPAEQVTFTVFWKFLWRERASLSEFMKWGARMKRLEAHRRNLSPELATGFLIKDISRAVELLRNKHEMSDDEIFRMLLIEGTKREVAARLVEFLPMAYCRIVLSGSGIHFPTSFQRMHNGKASAPQDFSGSALWLAVLQHAKKEAEAGVAKAMLSLVAAHGAEYKAVNELIQKGSKPEDIVLLPPIFIWPDEGPF